jgi:hypothetical protein
LSETAVTVIRRRQTIISASSTVPLPRRLGNTATRMRPSRGANGRASARKAGQDAKRVTSVPWRGGLNVVPVAMLGEKTEEGGLTRGTVRARRVILNPAVEENDGTVRATGVAGIIGDDADGCTAPVEVAQQIAGTRTPGNLNTQAAR